MNCKNWMIKYLLLFFILVVATIPSFSQKSKVDSIGELLAKEMPDSNRVTLMWKLADLVGNYNPEKALFISQEALFIANRIQYAEGQARSMGVLANAFIKLSNYPRALEYLLKKLQIEEKRNNQRNMASAIMSIGIVYRYQEEYRKSLENFYKSDSIIRANNIEDLKYYSAQNFGDVYDLLNISDSAYIHFSRALEIAKKLNDDDLMGASLTGLGHNYQKRSIYLPSLENYRMAIKYLTAADDDELLCEAALGIAKLFNKLRMPDSAIYYAGMSQKIARADGFNIRELDASKFLVAIYKQQNNIDSAFNYINLVQSINDTINSKGRIREAQIFTSNEQLRQLEIEENKKIIKQERVQQLQMLFIAIFIPGFFMISFLLSRINIHIKIIRVLGIISLLFLFEYLTLLLHPYVKEITHHTPVYEILIFVSLAAILIPAHHRIEHWFINKLVSRRLKKSGSYLKAKMMRIKLKR